MFKEEKRIMIIIPFFEAVPGSLKTTATNFRVGVMFRNNFRLSEFTSSIAKKSASPYKDVHRFCGRVFSGSGAGGTDDLWHTLHGRDV